MLTNHIRAAMIEWSSTAQLHVLWSRIPSQISLWFRILPMCQSILFYFQHHLECWIIWELFQGPITVRKNINHLNQDSKPPASITNILTSLGYHRWFKICVRGNRISWRSLWSTCKPMVRSVTHTHY